MKIDIWFSFGIFVHKLKQENTKLKKYFSSTNRSVNFTSSAPIISHIHRIVFEDYFASTFLTCIVNNFLPIAVFSQCFRMTNYNQQSNRSSQHNINPLKEKFQLVWGAYNHIEVIYVTSRCFKNPIEPLRTVEMMIIGFSLPWNCSTVPTSIPLMFSSSKISSMWMTWHKTIVLWTYFQIRLV